MAVDAWQILKFSDILYMVWKHAKGGFVYWLNRVLNPDHPWTDYYDPTRGETIPKDAVGNTLRGDTASYGLGNLESSSIFGTIGRGIESLITKWTDAGATGGEIERNQMQMQNAEDIYQRQVTGMQKAGINPALMYQNGASTPPSVTTQSSGAASMSDLMQLFMLPLQKRLIESQAKNQRDQGEAALITARANEQNATTNAGNLEVNRQNAATNARSVDVAQIRADIERYVAETNARLADKTIDKMAADIAYINETTAYISKNYEVALKNAHSNAKHAAAALRSAEAAFQNALTNEYLSNYQTDVYYSQCVLNELASQEKEIDISFLPEKQQASIYELRQRGWYFNQQGKLVDKTGKLVEAQTAETYTRMATEITHGLCEVVNTATGLIPGKSPHIGFK